MSVLDWRLPPPFWPYPAASLPCWRGALSRIFSDDFCAWLGFPFAFLEGGRYREFSPATFGAWMGKFGVLEGGNARDFFLGAFPASPLISDDWAVPQFVCSIRSWTLSDLSLEGGGSFIGLIL